MFSFQRQVVLGIAVVILSATLLFATYSSSLHPPSLSSFSIDRNLKLRQFHLLLPATAANLNFCRLLLSSTLTGYPEPILLGWRGHGLYDGAKSHLFKISEALAYLNTLPAERDDDLVLLLDAYDVWLLLPPEVIISRYESMIESANRKFREDDLYGTVHGGSEIRQSIFFGADKTCWPNEGTRAACWAVPGSPMRKYAFGPDTDSWMVPNRPRWLNSGTIIGPAKDMRDMFNGTMTTLQRLYSEEYEFRTSDQYYFQEMWAAQEVGRLKYRAGGEVEPPVLGRDSNGNEIVGVLPNVPEGERTEYHVTLDFESEIFQTSAAYAEYLVWMSFNHSTTNAPQSTGRRPRLDQLQLPLDVKGAAPPFGLASEGGIASEGGVASADNTVPGKKGWADVMLGLNTVTQTVFPLFHMTGDKELRDQWWPFLWFHPHGKALLSASLSASAEQQSSGAKRASWTGGREKGSGDADVIATVNGVRYTGAKVLRNGTDSRSTRGGAWSDQGVHLAWEGMCREYEEGLFGV